MVVFSKKIKFNNNIGNIIGYLLVFVYFVQHHQNLNRL